MENQLSNIPIQKEQKHGILSLVAGVLQVIFNSIGLSFLGIAGSVIFLINIIAGAKAFKESSQQKKMAIIGLSLSVVMIVLGLLGFQVSGSIFDYFWTKGF